MASLNLGKLYATSYVKKRTILSNFDFLQNLGPKIGAVSVFTDHLKDLRQEAGVVPVQKKSYQARY